MKKLLSLSLLFIWLGSMFAQAFNGKLNYHPEKFLRKSTSSTDTVKILAVMVEFKKYKDPVTSGDGTFGSIYTQAYGDTILDPTPFDAKYFSNHLDFAKNYFTKASNGRLNVAYTVLPQVITLPDSMRDYSPPPSNSKSNDQSNLGKLAKEVWEKVAAAYPDLDFSKYNLFAVFHAGVGREFSTPATLGNERDIPSVYLGINSLRNIYGSSFNGFSVNNGKYFITNTMILPCTESREVNSVSGVYLYQLTINGLIVSSIASHLGLPDLFNTATGTTSISRFGLMDGSSIFAYSGLFPPEPSAWEKIYLGWAEPITLSIKDAKIYLASRRSAAGSDTTILKVPINSTEYFLIENRQRDADNNGLKLTYNLNNQSYTFSLDKDKGRFQWYGVDTVKGVVTDVDDFDWAVPGNGIVIWHVDENIIDKTIESNTINADKQNRGLYVEEADGIFDIGAQYTSILGETVYGDGYDVDMWYAGNKGKYFKNIFGPDSKPNTNSNSGANSLITMQNFSAPANKMSFDISFGNSDVKLVTKTSLVFESSGMSKSLLALPGFYGPDFFVVDGNDLKRYNSSGKILSDFKTFSNVEPAGVYFSDVQYVVGAARNTLNIFSKNVSSETQYNSNDEIHKSIILPYEITSPITLAEKANQIFIYACTSDGHVLEVEMYKALSSEKLVEADFTKLPNASVGRIAISNESGTEYLSGFSSSDFYDNQNHHLNFNYGAFYQNVLTKDVAGNFVNVTLARPNGSAIFRIIQNGSVINSFELGISSKIDFSVADLFNDGHNYILFSNGNQLMAYNYSGGVADNFPFTEPHGVDFIGAPLAIDLNNDGVTEIIAYTKNGNIYVISPRTGKVIDGFPLSTGAYPMAAPVLYSETINGSTTTAKPYLIWLDFFNNLYVWSLSQTQGEIYWSGKYGDAGNTSYVAAPLSTNQTTEFFPTDKAYNYPNPVFDGETKIRYYVSESANVQIKIFDLAGGLVADLTDHAAGGFDNETAWDVTKVQSGVYYAHVQVNGESGKSASKIIKIAVIK